MGPAESNNDSLAFLIFKGEYMNWSEKIFIIVSILLFIVIVKFSGNSYPKLESKHYKLSTRSK